MQLLEMCNNRNTNSVSATEKFYFVVHFNNKLMLNEHLEFENDMLLKTATAIYRNND